MTLPGCTQGRQAIKLVPRKFFPSFNSSLSLSPCKFVWVTRIKLWGPAFQTSVWMYISLKSGLLANSQRGGGCGGGGGWTTASSSHKYRVLKCQNVTLCDHINPILWELPWLPVVYKIPLFTYKGLHHLAPLYIQFLLTIFSHKRIPPCPIWKHMET